MRMRQTAASMSAGGHAAPEAHFGAASELPAGRDAQIGQIFRNMRSVMKVSRETIARRLATSPSTIDSFEAGAIGALPRWKETARITRGYCELLRMDPEPILWRIRDQMQAAASQQRPSTPSRPSPPMGSGSAQAETRAAPGIEAAPAKPGAGRRVLQALLAVAVALAVVVGLAILTLVAPGPIYRAVELLPGPMAGAARAGLDQVMLLAAPTREGLKWIEVGDPRLRKADKLHTNRP
jgi:hypothetical protein